MAVIPAGILVGASVWAVREDMLRHRIPNALTASVLCIGLALNFSMGGWIGLGTCALGLLVGFAIFMPFYMMRAMGAGDVKLMAAFGALLGTPSWALAATIYALLAGTVLALGYLAIGTIRAAVSPVDTPLLMRIHTARERVQQLRRERFPYALAIATGALAAMLQRGDLLAFLDYFSGSAR